MKAPSSTAKPGAISEDLHNTSGDVRRRGKWTGGQVPLGYSISGGRLTVNEFEAIVVREIFTLYLEHGEVVEVVRILNERHRETKRYCSANGRMRESHAWTRPDVQRVLRNPLYAGYIRSGGALCTGDHPAVISPDMFARAEAALTSPRGKQRGHPKNHAYLLRDLLRCAGCGAAFTSASTTRGGRTYRYYRCVASDKRACHAKMLPADASEKVVSGHVRMALSARGDVLVDQVIVAVQEKITQRRTILCVECKALRSQVSELHQQAQRVVDLAGTADGVRFVYQETLTKLSAQLERSKSRLAEVEGEFVQVGDVTADAPWIACSVREFHRIWDNLSLSNRVRLVAAVLERIEVEERDRDVVLTLVDWEMGPATILCNRMAVATDSLV